MKIAIEGCCHGELNLIYRTIAEVEELHGFKLDLLICCGDFQAIRNEVDLQYLTCPPKYRRMMDFHEYFSGAKKAPVLTLFIGGNHEAPNILSELYYGGWVAPDIFYLGHSGVINFGGLRIAAVSGTFKHNDFHRGYYEFPPYNEDSKRSAYHMRQFEVKKLSLLKEPIDVFVSHDWPNGIEHYGDIKGLLRAKPHFEREIATHTLGNPHTMQLLKDLKPRYWFSAHLHVKFPAIYTHEDGSNTRFLALDKVIPGRRFLQILDIHPQSCLQTASSVSSVDEASVDCQLKVQEKTSKREKEGEKTAIFSASIQTSEENKTSIEKSGLEVCFDLEWLSILRANHELIPSGSVARQHITRPPTSKDFAIIRERLNKLSSRAIDHQAGEGADLGLTAKRYPWPSWKNTASYRDLASQRRDILNLIAAEDSNGDLAPIWSLGCAPKRGEVRFISLDNEETSKKDNDKLNSSDEKIPSPTCECIQLNACSVPGEATSMPMEKLEENRRYEELDIDIDDLS